MICFFILLIVFIIVMFCSDKKNQNKSYHSYVPDKEGKLTDTDFALQKEKEYESYEDLYTRLSDGNLTQDDELLLSEEEPGLYEQLF